MDLYRQAQEFPYTLKDGNLLVAHQFLKERGASKDHLARSVRRGGLLRPYQGAYLAWPTEPGLYDAARAALLVSVPSAVLGFETAAMLLGFGVLPHKDVHIVVRAGDPFPQRPGIVARQSVLPLDPIAEVMGLPCTPAARTAIDLVRTLPRINALPVLDAALQAGACTMADLEAELLLHNGLRGIRQARDLVPLADPRPQCRQESQLRLILLDAKITGFVPQLPVKLDGAPRYYIDLANPNTRVGAEYDGWSHLDPIRLRVDRARHNNLANLGWRMRYFTAHDLYTRPRHIAETIRRAI